MSTALLERPAAPVETESPVDPLETPMARLWRERGWYKVASTRFGGDTIIRAANWAPIHELHDGCVVYRNTEIRRQMLEPAPLEIWHPYRKALFEKWIGGDWKSHKQIGQMRQAAKIEDSERRTIIYLVEHLVACGVIEHGEADGRLLYTECYRLATPSRRVRP